LPMRPSKGGRLYWLIVFWMWVMSLNTVTNLDGIACGGVQVS
jgi:hypothetical protein